MRGRPERRSLAAPLHRPLYTAVARRLGSNIQDANRYATIIDDAGQLAPYVTFTRSSTATYYGSDGLLKTAAANEPRYDYDPATLQLRGLLIEEQRTNKAINSGALQNYTTLLTPAVTANAATAPDGTMTATQFEVAAGQTGFALRNVGPSSLVGNNANSIYFKLVGGTTGLLSVIRADRSSDYCSVNVATLAPLTMNASGVSNATAIIEPLPNGWYRLKGAYTSDAAVETRVQFTSSTAGAKILLWGVQAEQGALFSTSYIPTTTASVTRSLDLANVSTLSSVGYNFAEGSMFFEGSVFQTGKITYLWQIDDATSNNRIAANRQAAGTLYEFTRAVSGDNGDLPNSAAVTLGTQFKHAFGWKTNDLAASLNGAAVRTDTLASVSSAVTTIRIGISTSGSDVWNGHIRRLRYYNRRLSNAQLQALTAP